MSTITVTKDDAVRYVDTNLEVNRQQFAKGIPDPPESPYSVMELNEVIRRTNANVVNSSLQGIANALAALFNTETYRTNYTRGIHIEYPDGGTFSVDPYDPTDGSSYRVGNEPFDFDSNGHFIAPAVPLLEAGSYGDTAFIYGQPDKTIDDGELVHFVLNQDGDPTKPIKYTFKGVNSKETPDETQIEVYSFGDPEVVRTALMTLPQGNEIYNHIMTAGNYGFTWGRFKWDEYRWENPKPGGLYPSKFDSYSKAISFTSPAHHNGVVNRQTDLTIQDELSDDGLIMMTAGQVMWNGLKIYLAGESHYLPEIPEDEDQSPLDMADPVTAAASGGLKVSELTISPVSRNVMAPTTMLIQPTLVLQTDDPAELPYEIVTSGFTGTGTWSFTTTNPLFSNYDYTLHLVTLDGAEPDWEADTIEDFGLEAVFTVTPSTKTITVTAGMSKPTAGQYVAVFATRLAVASDLSINEALRYGYYPLFQHPWQEKSGSAYSWYDPNTIDFVDKNGDILSREVLAKHTETVFDPESNDWDEYYNALNDNLRDFTVGGVDGRLCYTETENIDDTVTLKLKHTTNETYEAEEVVWAYDAKEDGLLSTGVPRDTQKYLLDQSLLFFSSLGDLESCEAIPTVSACETTDTIEILCIPRDSNGNRMANMEFTITDKPTGYVTPDPDKYISRLDGTFLFSISPDAFTSGVCTKTFTLNCNGTAISCSVTMYENR
jgi:hypothetical protein